LSYYSLMPLSDVWSYTKAQTVVAELRNRNVVRKPFTNSSKLLLHLQTGYF
jgi:hypothetical protein